MKYQKIRTRAISLTLTMALVLSAVAFGVMTGAADASAVERSSVRPRLGVVREAVVKVAAEQTVVVQTKPAPKQETAIVTQATTSTSATKSTKVSTRTSSTSSSSSASELAQAQSILAGYIAKYPILAGSTVTIGATPNNYQAVCYYKSGKIIINPNHTASLTTIIKHEIGHIIDWRDNGVIDWGENIPAL